MGQPFDIGRTNKNPQKTGDKGCPYGDCCTGDAIGQPTGVKCRHKPNKFGHQNKRPRGCFRQPEAIHHGAGLQPAKLTNHILRHIGQHRIGTAKCNDSKLAEEITNGSQLCSAKNIVNSQYRKPPQRRPMQQGEKILPAIWKGNN